jgi:hypothetical protein
VQRGDDRADRGVRRQRVADPECGGVGGEAADHLVVAGLVHQYPGGRGADLAGVEGPGGADRGDGGAQVGVVQDDAGALAAELQQQPLHGEPAVRGDPAADGGGPGEADHVDVRGSDQRGAGARPRAGDHVEDPGWCSGLLEHLAQLEAAQRVLRGGLGDDRVAGRERGGELSGQIDDGEVVGGDAADHAHRAPRRDRAGQTTCRQRRGGDRLRDQGAGAGFQRPTGIAAEALGRDRDLHRRGDPDGGSGLGLQQWYEVVATGQQHVGDAVQERRARSGGGPGPGVERLPGGGDGLRHIGGRRLRSQADDLLGGRVDHRVAAVPALAPDAVDEQSGR